MKFKMPSGGGGLKPQLAHHVEKIIFGVVALLSLVIVMSGFGKRDVLNGTVTPKTLQQKKVAAENHIESFSWEEHFRPQRDTPQNYLERVQGLSQPVQLEGYAVKQLIRPPYVPPRTLRNDPPLLPVVDLRALPGHGVLATKTAGGRGPTSLPPGLEGMIESRDQSIQTDDSFINAESDTAGQGVYFVSVTGLVPRKQQIQLYFDALADSDEFDLTRDQPNFIEFIIERAEVTGDAAATLDWNRIGWSRKVLQAKTQSWAGSVNFPEPVVLPECQDPIVTTDVPPIKGAGDFEHWLQLVGHPKLPREKVQDVTEAPAADGTPPMPGDAFPLGSFSSPLSEPGALAETRGSGTGNQFEQTGEKSERERFLEAAPDFLLFRYVDYSVQPGKRYSYRVQLFYADPNNPKEKKPSITSLEAEVADRVSKARNVNYRTSEYSEPSSPVLVQSGHEVLAGEIVIPDGIPVRGVPNVTYLPARIESQAKLVGVEFDPQLAAEKAVVVDAKRGSVLNGSKDIKVRLPLSNRRGTLPEADVSTDVVVVDMMGGGTIGSTSLKAPGRVLLWTADGQFEVAEDVDAVGKISPYLSVDEPEAPKPDEPAPRDEERPGPPGRERGGILNFER